MLTYALFIATDPDPVSSDDWSHIDQVYDRARLSSGGTIVRVRATEGDGRAAEDYDIHVSTFVNGIQIALRDDGPEAFSYLADGDVIGTATVKEGQWVLVRVGEGAPTDTEAVATLDVAGHTREDAQLRLGKIVEDWLT